MRQLKDSAATYRIVFGGWRSKLRKLRFRLRARSICNSVINVKKLLWI